jgi:PAS domain S-box-containing protein
MDEARVLIVEDERIVALDMQSQLQNMGYAVQEIVSYGEDAVHRVAAGRPDLVLMDIHLKGEMDGIEAAHRIRTQFDIPVIYLTAFADQDTLDRAKLTAPFGYVLKPFEERELRATIEMALYRHRAERELQAYAARLEKANRQLALVNWIVTASADGQEPHYILQTTCRELAQILNVPHAVAVLLDEDRATAQVVGEFLVDGQTQALGAHIRVAATPLIQDLLERREPLVIDDLQKDLRLAPFCGFMRQSGTFSLLILPLIMNDQVAGALGLVGKQGQLFAAEEIELAQMVAGQLSAALARAWLAAEHKRLSAALEQAAEGVIITDAEGGIVYANRAFEQITGYLAAEVLGEVPRVLKSSVQEADAHQELQATIQGGQTWQGRLVNRRKDGSTYDADITVAPVYNGNGQLVNYVSIQRDVTEELEREGQYRQALKMEAVGRLASGIAHDFNNLLTAINGYAALLEMELSPADAHYDMVKRILVAGERAADLTRQLLTFSRKQSVEPLVVNLDTIIAEMRGILTRAVGEHIAFDTRLANDLWSIKVDPVQMERVIVNLAVNARDAMPNGGQLTIETANVTLDEASASFDLVAQPGEYVLLAIRDTGIGMSREVQSHLFEPFFTTKEIGKGTGLGLATVYGIVKQNGGTIRVDTGEGRGTAFEVYLPRAQEEASSAGNQPEQARTRPGRKTILLVEDNEQVSALMRWVLAGQGYVLLEAHNGQEAGQLAAGHQGAIDLLVTDVVMPGMNGVAAAELLSESRPGLKVLFISGYADDVLARHGLLEDEVAFLHKPFTPNELTLKVRSVLDDAPPFRASLGKVGPR